MHEKEIINKYLCQFLFKLIVGKIWRKKSEEDDFIIALKSKKDKFSSIKFVNF